MPSTKSNSKKSSKKSKKSKKSKISKEPIASSSSTQKSSDDFINDSTPEQLKNIIIELQNKEKLYNEQIAQKDSEIDILKKNTEENNAEIQQQKTALTELRSDQRTDIENLVLAHQDEIAELRKKYEAEFQGLIRKQENTVSKLRYELDLQTKAILSLKLQHQQAVEVIHHEREKHQESIEELFKDERAGLREEFEQKLDLERNSMRIRHRSDLERLQSQSRNQLEEINSTHVESLKIQRSEFENQISAQDKIETTEELNEVREKLLTSEKQLIEQQSASRETRMKNKMLEEELKRVQDAYEKLKKKSAAAFLTQERCQRLAISLDKLQNEYDALEAHALQTEVERDELYDRFVAAIFEIQRQSSMENSQLEQKMLLLIDDLELKDLQLRKVVEKMRRELPNAPSANNIASNE